MYRAIVEQLHSAIASGLLQPGDRLPTHRELAVQLGLARGTVMRAYRLAETHRLVESTVGRGSFVAHRRSTAELPGQQTHPPSNGGIDLSANRPLYCSDPDLGPVLAALASDPTTNELLRYVDIEGSLRHRAAGAAWCRDWGVHVRPENILVCAGAQHALCVAMSGMNRGDVIATDCLTYPAFKAVAEAVGVELMGIAMDEMGMKPKALSAACQARRVRAMYMIPTIHNPTGLVMDIDRRRALVDIAESRDLTIIEDDIHRLYATDAPTTFAELAPRRTVFIAATSKCVAGALRVAFIAAPDHMLPTLRRAVLSTVWNAPPLMAEIFTRWLADGTIARTVDAKRREAGARMTLAKERLPAELLRGHSHALSAWLLLPPAWESSVFALQAQRMGVAVSHDAVFAVGPAPSPAGVRLSLSAPLLREDLIRGLSTIAKLLTAKPGAGDAMH